MVAIVYVFSASFFVNMNPPHTIFLLFIFVVTHSVLSNELATITFKDGSVQESIFVKMDADSVFLQIPSPDGSAEIEAFHKSIFQKILFENAASADLTAANSEIQQDTTSPSER
jgi:hypothetical protein